MDVGISYFDTDEGIHPVELGRAAEEAGFESLFLPEHTHIPASRETPRPGGGELPRRYWHLYDPFVALSVVAGATTRLKLGTGVCLVVERDPIVTAKAVASLDHLSGGRLLFGVGAGWNVEEMRNHGTDPKRRFALMRERVLAMKAIWTQPEPEYRGEFVSFGPIWSWPKPAQRPHPPILMGGNGPKAFDRVLEYADEWLPNTKDLDTLGERIADLRRRGEEAGRARIGVTYFGARAERDVLAQLEEAGVDRCLVTIEPGTAAEVLPRVQEIAELAGLRRPVP
jgi:probable F420-dependent oxidoreductase